MEAPAYPYRQRANALVHLPPLLAELGVSLEQVLQGTGIAPAELVPGAFLPYANAVKALDRAAEVSGREDIGLLLAQRQSLASLGPAGEVMRHAGTLGEALNDFIQFQIWNSSGAATYLYRTPDDFALGYGIYDPAGISAIQIHDVAVGAGCTIISILTGRRVRPVEIWSMRPPPADPAPLARFAGCPVRYGQDQNCIFLPPDAVDLPLADADPALHAATLKRLAAHAAAEPWGSTAAVRHALRAAIATGRTGMPEIAAHLGRHPRSLRRALEREGTTFTALRDEVRCIVARELLSLTSMPVGRIAMALNFADASAFTHAFRHWSGTSPSDWRRAQAEGRSAAPARSVAQGRRTTTPDPRAPRGDPPAAARAPARPAR